MTLRKFFSFPRVRDIQLSEILLAVAVLLAFMALAFTPVTAMGAEVALPFANVSGYSTTLVINNPTHESIEVPEFWKPYSLGGPLFFSEAFSTARASSWPREGGGIASFDLPTGLIAYSEVRDPDGQIIRVGPLAKLSPNDVLQFQDLLTDNFTARERPVSPSAPGYASFIFIATAAEASTVSIDEWCDSTLLRSQTISLSAQDVKIPELGSGTNRVTLRVGIPFGGGAIPTGPVYAFAIVSDKTHWSEFAVQ